MGAAKGLAFLHEESTLRVVHRDIKTTNVLLDKNLNPKISDFGLAKLDSEEKTHISTRVAGTMYVGNFLCQYLGEQTKKGSSSNLLFVSGAEDIWHQNMHYGVT